MKMIRTSAPILACTVGMIGAVALAGVASGQPARKAASAPVAAHGLTTPLTLLQIMRANVEIPADGIWAVENNEKLSADDWLLAEQDATNIIASSSFIMVGGTGPKDKGWVAHKDYQAWAKDVQVTGIKILAAVKAKDQTALATAADHLSDTCQSCHDKYRPMDPSDGVARFPYYPPRVIKK